MCARAVGGREREAVNRVGKLGELKSSQMNLYLYCRLHMCVNMREGVSECVCALSVRECMNVCMYVCENWFVCGCVCVYACMCT